MEENRSERKCFMRRKVFAFTLLIALLVASFPLLASAEALAETETATQAALAEAASMLAQERESGVLMVFMEDGVGPEEAQELFEELDILSDLDDCDTCRYRSYDDFSTGSIWFELIVSEDRIVEILAELNLSAIVANAFPNYSISLGDEECYPIETVPPIAEGTAGLNGTSTYDPMTTSWAMDQIHYANSWERMPAEPLLVGVMDTGYNPHEDVDCVNMELARNVVNTTYTTDITDYYGHGTFIVGQIGATLNGFGVNGVCANVSIVPIKITATDKAFPSAMARAAKYAEEVGIKVLNLSYGCRTETRDTILEANYTGVLVIAAGNDNTDVGAGGNYGHVNNISNWLFVGATTSDGTKASFSNYNQQYVDLFAPGDGIDGIGKNGTNYVQMTGTSMAAPFVTAAAAILLENNPCLTPTEVCDKLIATASKTSALTQYCVSGGILNLAAATDSLYSDNRGAYSLGDINGDGYVTEIDYMLLKRYVLGTYTLNENALQAADVNGDAQTDAIDYMLVYRFVLKTFYFPPCL